MKRTFIFTALIILTLNTMSQNKHPMQFAMVSVFVEDPVKAFKYYTDTLGFEEVMFVPEHHLAIVKSPLDPNGVSLLLEPTEPGGLSIAKRFKSEIYKLGLPMMTLSCPNIEKTVKELKAKGVKFKKGISKTDFGFECIFDDNNGNYLQLIQLN